MENHIHRLIISAVLVLSFLLSACGNHKQKKQSIFTDTQQKASTVQANTTDTLPGKIVYQQVCLPCHQADAGGAPGMFPPLIDTKWINGDNETLIKLILNGMSGPVTVKNQPYTNVMPPNKTLTDKQIADVLTYVRLKFNKLDKPVTPEEVKKLRGQ